MTILLFGFIYASVLVFLIASVARAVTYARAPVHLRWELYPVPHEEARRVVHGGSYFEATDWWEKPSHFNLAGELKFMVPEMLFLKGLWEFNRKMWFRSFPFHFGLYLLIATMVLLVLGALLRIFSPPLMDGGLGTGLVFLIKATGIVGIVSALLGALGLLSRRLTDKTLKNYSTPGDIFNLLFFIIAFGLLLAGYALSGPEFPGALVFAQALLTFDTTVAVPPLLAAGLLLSSLLAAYIPMTHMSHFIAKYFTYHSIRWDDQPSAKNARLTRRIAEVLTYRPTWAAPHMMADGTKTWVDVATTNPAQGDKK